MDIILSRNGGIMMNTIYYTVKTIGDNVVITMDYPKELLRDSYDADRVAKAVASSILTGEE